MFALQNDVKEKLKLQCFSTLIRSVTGSADQLYFDVIISLILRYKMS